MALPTILALCWAAPCSALGLVAALCPLALGGKARWVAGALEVSYRPRLAECGPRSLQWPFRAMVLGHVILALSEEDLHRLGPHERVHVAQYGRWGPLFFIAYGLSAGWQLLHRRSPYWHNHFEVEARRLGPEPEPPCGVGHPHQPGA